MQAPKLPPVQYDLVRLGGGLDQITPTLSLPPGVARRAANFECSLNGGYTRIAGYERFDGRPNPSDAVYNALTVTLVASVAVGDVIDNAGATASGTVIAVDGSTIVITKQTGTFAVSDSLKVGMTTVGTLTDQTNLVADAATDAAYKNLAADEYRADIAAVPGSGSIRGVAVYQSTVYAWRDNAGGTALDIYKSSGSGWTAVPLGVELAFDGGLSSLILDGQTVTGLTSGATGVVTRAVYESGTIAGNDAAGRLIFSSVTGTFVDNEHIQVGGVTKAHANGTQSSITLAPGGRVETVVANFGGGANNKRLYGCDGENRAFEFDGTVYVPINSTYPTDTPNHIAFHKNHLFLSFDSSLQNSSIGDPYVWSAVTGAAEIAMNDTITALVVLPGDQSNGAMAVYTRTDTAVLYGTSSADFSLSSFNVGTGAIAYTGQNLDQSYFMSDRGVMSLSAAQEFGNFATAALTVNLRPFVQQRRNLATASLINSEKGQYRVFFSDGYALYVTIANGKFIGAMPMQFDNPVTCAVVNDDTATQETSFFGSTNGFVYRLDAGTSFDGAQIAASVSFVFHSIRSPRVVKRFRKASVEVTGEDYAEFSFGYELGYASTEYQQPPDEMATSDLRGSYWDDFSWDNFIWDGVGVRPSEIPLGGDAENIGIRISSASDELNPFTVNSIMIHFTPRRGLR